MRADAGAGAPDGGRMSIWLARTPRGLVGQARAIAFVPSGQPCPVEFLTEVISCDDAGILVRSAASAAVDESCRSQQSPSPTAMMEHRLLRQATSTPGVDAGGTE